jgi:hypothetical protein
MLVDQTAQKLADGKAAMRVFDWVVRMVYSKELKLEILWVS